MERKRIFSDIKMGKKLLKIRFIDLYYIKKFLWRLIILNLNKMGVEINGI